jgi:hypothetical protein
MRQRSLRFSVIISLLTLSFLVVTAAPAFAKKPKKRKAAAEKAERLKRESEARIAALYQMAMARTNQIATPSQPVIGTMNDGNASIVAPVTSATNAQFLADDAAPPALAPLAGTLLISEFRLQGVNGANDEFIEIYNNSGADHTVAAISGTGYGVAASDGVLRCTIPNGTVIPNKGHFLCVNSVGYSYSTYPEGNGTTATGDATYTTDIPVNAGIALFNNNSGGGAFQVANRFDAVGSATEANTLYKEGTGYPALNPALTFEHSFVRDECGKGGTVNLLGPCTISTPKDTDDNSADFFFVDTNGTSSGAGQRLGAPGPQNLSAPIQRNSSFTAAFLDSTATAASPPNRVRDFTSAPAQNSTFGTLSIRRRFVNNTGGNVTLLRFRIIDLDTFPAASGFADLRPRTSTAVVVAGINDPVTCTAAGMATPCTVTLEGTTLEQDNTAPSTGQPNGGGFNSSMSAGTITLATPLANGASINLQFLLGLQQTGNFRFYVNIEALP